MDIKTFLESLNVTGTIPAEAPRGIQPRGIQSSVASDCACFCNDCGDCTDCNCDGSGHCTSGDG